MGNRNLHDAKRAKNDEFYTRYEDIEKEIVHYDLKGMAVYCNCDDYRLSNFVKYFKNNFESLGIRHLTATNYDIGEGAWRYDYDGKEESVSALSGSGDFRSEECIEFLKEADVVVTNPPFSLFREYVKQLMDYGKKFIIIGYGTAIAYKEIFPYIENNEMWLGATKISAYKTYNGDIAKVFSYWYTNVEHKKRNTPMDLYKRYSNEYKHYGNLEAIDIPNVNEIPFDYNGVMGVPVSFLENFCPSQFEILGNANIKECLIKMGATQIGEENLEKMRRQGIKRHITKNSYDLFTLDNGVYHNIFSRILIRKRTA